VAKITKHSNY